MVKCIILNGIAVVFEAILSVAGGEQEEDKDHPFSRSVIHYLKVAKMKECFSQLHDFDSTASSREGWVPDRMNEVRGLEVLHFLHRENDAKIMDRLHAHRDLREYALFF